MEKFNLKFKGNGIVLIDWANIRNQQKKLGWTVDLKKLYEWLDSHENIKKIQFFYGFENNKKSKKFLKKVESFGFEVITKEVKYLRHDITKSHFRKNVGNINNIMLEEIFEGRLSECRLDEKDFNKLEKILKKLSMYFKTEKPKCDFDVEITTEIMRHFADFQTIILLSGDGDFAYPVSECLKSAKKVYIISHRDFIGKEIWNFKKQTPNLYPSIINLEKIKFIKNSPSAETDGIK